MTQCVLEILNTHTHTLTFPFKKNVKKYCLISLFWFLNETCSLLVNTYPTLALLSPFTSLEVNTPCFSFCFCTYPLSVVQVTYLIWNWEEPTIHLDIINRATSFHGNKDTPRSLSHVYLKHRITSNSSFAHEESQVSQGSLGASSPWTECNLFIQ